jgi:hypothetical protein
VVTGVQSTTRGKTKHWLGAGALTLGLGAAALACGSGVANADNAGPASHHTIVARHSPVKPVAHATPRTKPSAALIVASTLTGVANHKPAPAAAITHSVTASSAPPNPATAHASAVPKIVNDLAPLLGRLVELGSSIQHFNVVAAVQAVFVNPIRTAIQTAVSAIHTVIGDIESLVGEVVSIVALPVEIPLYLVLLYGAVRSGLWF